MGIFRAENARLSLPLIPADSLAITAVAHATSARRLAETLRFESTNRGMTSDIRTKPSNYAFDPKNSHDQDEAIAELLRLADWPAKGWLGPQTDLPDDLVHFARSMQQRSLAHK